MPSVKFYSNLSDVANVLAGLSLVTSFFMIMLQYTFEMEVGAQFIKIYNIFMFAEGVFYFIGGFALAKLFIQVKDPASAVSQTIIAFGGLFFAVSGWNAPVFIVSIRYLFPVGAWAQEGNVALAAQGLHPLDVAAACPFYGITCFMIATASGAISVRTLPKGKFISLYWGIMFFFFGAYTIGICALWGPLLAGGFSKISDYPIGIKYPLGVFSAPIGSKYTHPFQLLGAIFLTTGAVIFAIMNASPPPADAQKLVDTNIA